MRGRGEGWPPGPRFWDSHLSPATTRQTVHFVDTLPSAFCLCIVRALEVGLLQRPGALLREVHAGEEGLEAGVGGPRCSRRADIPARRRAFRVTSS